MEAPEPSRPARDRTLGTDIYLIFCEHLAGTEYPNDVRGRVAKNVCHENEPAPADAPRLEALRLQRARLVSALDAILAEDAYAEDELSGFIQELIPLFDRPKQELPRATQAVAAVLESLRQDPESLSALARISGRQGYRPLEHALGTVSAVFRYPRLRELLRTLTRATGEDGVAHEAFQQLLDALGMELATYEPVPRGETGTLDVARSLLLKHDPGFSTGEPLLLVERDARGFVRPQADAPMGLTDQDRDGFSDVDALGRFVNAAGQPLALPPPFRVLAEVEGRAQATRDAAGRATGPGGAPLYSYFDVDLTLLAGLSADLTTWAAPDEHGYSTLLGFMHGLPLVMGPQAKLEARFGKGTLGYAGHDLAAAPLPSLVDFASLALEAPEFDEALMVFDRLVTEHEDVAARFATALLRAKARADQDTQAHIEHPSNFWDEVLTLLRRLAARQLVPTAEHPDVDETALESLMRAMAEPGMRHLGGQIAMMGRFNALCQEEPYGPVRACIDIDGSHINGPVVGRYLTAIDRSKADRNSDAERNDAGNTSQLQSFLMLVSELMDRPLCNKKTTGVELMAALGCPGSPLSGLAGAAARAFGAALGDIEECGFIHVPDMGRAFGQAMMNGTGNPEQEKIGLDLLDYLSNDFVDGLVRRLPEGARITTFDKVFKTCSGVDDFDTTPSGAALARVLFAPQGSKTHRFANELFSPPTLRPYLPGTSRPFDVSNPPADLTLAEVFKGSLPVWEIAWQFGDASPAALMGSIVPLMHALNEHDFFPPLAQDPASFRKAGAPYYDSEQYLFNPLVGALALHYPSKRSGYQNKDPNQPRFSYFSNLTSYEGMLVDMLAEPDLKPNRYVSQKLVEAWNGQSNIGLFVALNDLLAALSSMDMGNGKDGIDVMAVLMKRLLNPHVYCAPDAPGYIDAAGRGACDCDRDGDGTMDRGAPASCAQLALRKPITLRGKGRDHVTWERGQAWDGSDAQHPFRPLAPVDVLLEALNDYDAVFDAHEEAKERWRAARSDMIDVLFETDGKVFTNPRTMPLLRAVIAWGREQLARRRAEPLAQATGEAESQAQGADVAQEAVRAWALGLPERTEQFLESPVVASAFRLIEDLHADPDASRELSRLVAHLFDAKGAGAKSFRPMILALADLLQVLRDGHNLPPIMRAMSRAMVPNVNAVIDAGEPVTRDPSPVDELMTFVRAVVETEGAGTLSKLLERLVTPDSRHLGAEAAPLETTLDVISEVHRRKPGAGTLLDAADIEAMLGPVAEFLLDEERGMARMVEIVQNRAVEARTVVPAAAAAR